MDECLFKETVVLFVDKLTNNVKWNILWYSQLIRNVNKCKMKQ